MSNLELTALLHDLKENQRMIEQLTAECEAIKDEVKAFLGDREEYTAGEYKVTYKTVTSSRIDTAALKKALPEIAAQFSKPSTVRRFSVA